MYSYYINLALYNPSVNHKTLWLNSWRKKRDILTSNVLSFLSNVYTKIGEKEIWNNYTVQFNIPYPFIHLHTSISIFLIHSFIFIHPYQYSLSIRPSILIFTIHSSIHTNIPYPFIHLHPSISIFTIHSSIHTNIPYPYSFILLICIHPS